MEAQHGTSTDLKLMDVAGDVIFRSLKVNVHR